jgi:hypothetical protein
MFKDNKLHHIEMPDGKKAYADEIETHYAESFDAEEYLPLGKDNWDLYELDDGSKNIKIADKITTKFNQEMHKTIKMVKEGSNPDKEAEKLFDKMEKFMDKYWDEGATDSEPMDVLDETINQVFEKHGYSLEYYDAESFEAQRKLTDIDRDGKPYTGQIYPDHPDLDPVKADRNKDGYMSSWERALGNQVARGMEKYKSERNLSMKRMSMRKTSRKSTSILPSVIVVGVIAAIVGSKIRK